MQPTVNDTKKSRLHSIWEKKKCVPCSTKATEYKITLSHGVKENDERVSFLEQQVQRAKDTYKSTQKTVIEECLLLEIQAATKAEMEIIMDLLPAISSAIQTLQAIDCDRLLQLINVLSLSPTLLQLGPIATTELFLGFYQTHHSLDAIPNPSIVTLEAEYSIEE